MECLKATYGADDESIDNAPKEPPQQCCVEDPKSETLIRDENPEQQQQQQLTIPKSEEEEEDEEQEKHNSNNNGDTTTTTTTNDDEEFEESTPRKKHKSLSACLDPPQPAPATKKPKKKSNNVWSKPTSRKGKKKIKSSNNNNNNNHNNNGNHISNGSNHQNHTSVVPDMAWITSAPRVPDRLDDSPEQTICLSKVYKAEKVELSEDRMSAGSTKGYRMVRATRGVSDGAWYFEIKIVRLGETGHTRLGWATGKGDLQAPVGYDANSFGYRDIDGSKVHKALRERYGEDGYREGDVVGFYISLPEGNSFEPKPPQTVWIKGQRYLYSDDGKDNPPKVVPGSEISFFKNGLCQGVAFKDLFGGCYYPAASMYTLPNQPNCEVKFNFGPDFEFFPQDFDGRPVPKLMIEVPYDGGVDGITENGTSNDRKN